MQNEFFTITEVANIFKVSNDTVVRLIKDAKLTAMKVGAQWRIEQDSIDAYLKPRTLKAKKQPCE